MFAHPRIHIVHLLSFVRVVLVALQRNGRWPDLQSIQLLRWAPLLVALVPFIQTPPAGGQQLYKLTASDAAANDEFGHAVALSGDTALVGAAWKDGEFHVRGSEVRQDLSR
jgi:hypothetical protein